MSNFPAIQNHSELSKAVSARDLYNFLEINRDFSTWITGRIDQFDFSRGEDFIASTIPQIGGKGGRPLVEYYITIDMAKELAMVERNEKGREVRKYFIECEKQLKANYENVVVQSLPNFNDPVAAARAWADAKESEQKALEQIEESKPALLVYEALANRRMDCNTTTLAKQLGTTATKLNIFLKSHGIKFKHQDLPMATHADWFNVVTGVAKNGYETIQCLITPLGQIEIAKLWNKGSV